MTEYFLAEFFFPDFFFQNFFFPDFFFFFFFFGLQNRGAPYTQVRLIHGDLRACRSHFTSSLTNGRGVLKSVLQENAPTHTSNKQYPTYWGSVTQRHNSILAILRKSGLCVTEHLSLKELSLCFTSHWLQWGCWVELSLCFSWRAHIFLNISISNKINTSTSTHFGKIWSKVFVTDLDIYSTICTDML